ncbi:MAG: hypothetical protein N2Z23_00725 [Pyrinomonadaceae bacterium]|nr:hypothetical protein [Pyrinomonadaceae bacterium]MCX7638957.1 hypothetical protein [Pyrinomonadaceae bacterium]MDW8304906.1 hypothetical protein [Acidobacteriota bacterium]
MKSILVLLVLIMSFDVAFTQNRSTRQQTQQKQTEKQNAKSQSQRQTSNQDVKKETEYKIAKEGVGIEGIVVGKSTMQDVIKKFGKDYKWIVHKKYSYQMAYPNGLSFYICQSDKRKEIFDIEIKPPYKARTSRGVILGVSTVEDVQRIYGKSKDGLEYRGVNFYYTNQKGKRVITTIDIVENSGLRQCKVEENKKR